MIDASLPLPAFGAALSAEVITSVNGLANLEVDFARLQAVTGNALPFALYEWQLTWCRHFLRCDAAILDEPMFHVFRTPDRTCIAIIPLIRTRRRVATFSVTSLGLLGADPGMTEIQTPLVAPGYEDRVAEALNRSLTKISEWDWIHWNGPCDAFGKAIGRSRNLRWQAAPANYVLDLPGSWEEFRAGLKRNIRESLRHCYNSLKRDGHAFELKIASGRSEVRSALERLFELHALRSRMENTIEHPDRFASARLRDFVCDVCDQLAARGAVRLFQIEIGGRVVAMRIGFVVADSLYLYYSGFDPDWSRYSVMTTTVAEAIKYAIAQGLKTVNLSPGSDVSKTRWGPREVPHNIAYEHNGRLRSRLVGRAYLKASSGDWSRAPLLKHLLPGRRTWN